MDFDQNRPIFLQIKEKIQQDIISGALPEGSRIPSVREYALEFKVNPNTVQRALSALEQEGLLETRRTTGRFVAVKEKTLRTLKKEEAVARTASYIQTMKSLGLQESEVLDMIHVWWSKEHE